MVSRFSRSGIPYTNLYGAVGNCINNLSRHPTSCWKTDGVCLYIAYFLDYFVLQLYSRMVFIQDMACQCQENDDDHDSGTESDDEGADAEELEKYMDDSLHGDGSSAPSDDRASSTLDTITDTTTEGCGGAGCSPNLLDSALPSDSDHTFDHHSSEEELEVINCGTIAKYPEKRKWSQANTRLSLGSGSSDEEVRDLMCVSAPVEFRSSPPANVPKPSRSLSPPPKLFHASTTIPPHELCSVSPRKRHRRTLLTTATTATSTNLVEHRPSLDFEKMQQNRRKRSSQAYVTRGKSYILYENV